MVSNEVNREYGISFVPSDFLRMLYVRKPKCPKIRVELDALPCDLGNGNEECTEIKSNAIYCTIPRSPLHLQS